MTDNLVKRLRIGIHTSADEQTLRDEAADRIEQLEAALKKIAQHDMQAIAMDALRPGERIRNALDAK